MWMLGQKDGKPWWQKKDTNGNWIPITEEEAASEKKYWNDKKNEIAAKIFNEHFNKSFTDEELHQIDASNQHQGRDE